MNATVPFSARLGQLLDALEPERTQKWLAEQSGLSEATVSRLFQGKRNPDAVAVEALGPVLGVTPGELVRGTDAEDRLAESREWVRKQQYDVALSTIREQKAANEALATELAQAKAALTVETRIREELERNSRDAYTQASDLARRIEVIQSEKNVLDTRVKEQRDDLRLHRRALDDAAQQIEGARREIRRLTVIAEDLKRELVKLGRTSLVTKILAAVAAAAATASAVTAATLLAQARDDEEREHEDE